jgi:hypothetical protein
MAVPYTFASATSSLPLSQLDANFTAAQSTIADGSYPLTSPVLGGYFEVVSPVSDGPSVALSPTNGTIQTWTLGANRTPTAGTWGAGQSMTLMINDTGSTYSVTWTTIGVVWVGGIIPVLTPGGGFTIIELWKVNSTIYGALVGQVT